ncbi:unnamed protein product [Rotaria sordida]|uniref:Uncharacterized protein n=1 Tax=Rotaria sordida TaxID=392033 RepID=A0A814SAN9_9BILA|nr:unnamed protein product [Rotaria sordida]CAF1448975.1 unnamed protein product [Rotaria sordida]
MCLQTTFYFFSPRKLLVTDFIQGIVLCYFSCIECVKISSCAKWNRTGVTIAGTGIAGSSAEQLHDPTGIFIHKKTNILYVADYGNKRIQTFDLNKLSTTGNTVASLTSNPHKVFVDDDSNGPTIYISLPLSDHIEKWVYGATSGVPIGDACFSCLGIWVDKEKNLYTAESSRFRVRKWSPQTNNSTVVAGRTDLNGSTPDRFGLPDGISVDETIGDIYVTDYINNRVQKWAKDSETGMTVAGSDFTSFSGPSCVMVDEETKTMYIVDRHNARVQRWLAGAPSGDTVVGVAGRGNSSDQLNEPRHADFDSKGNLYVSDAWNHRVQMYTLIDNEPCRTSAALSIMFKSTMIQILFSMVTLIMAKVF